MSFIGTYTQALGMTTERWMELPAQALPVNALTPTQDVGDDLWPERRPTPIACADPCVHVVQLGSVYYLEDGHHRWARARRDRKGCIDARVLVVA